MIEMFIFPDINIANRENAMIYTLLSNRGGVGKTTIAANLSIAISKMGEKTLIAEGDLGAASLYLVLGVDPAVDNFRDILEGKGHIEDAALADVYPNLTVLPNKVPIKTYYEVEALKFVETVRPYADNFSTTIVDGPAGIGKSALISMKIADEIIIVTNPNPPAVTAALKLKKVIDALKLKTRGIIISKIPPNIGQGFLKQIEVYFDLPILGIIPDDPKAEVCYRRKTPIVEEYPANPISKEITKIAQTLVNGA
jgi:septum site-determining protein MinD